MGEEEEGCGEKGCKELKIIIADMAREEGKIEERDYKRIVGGGKEGGEEGGEEEDDGSGGVKRKFEEIEEGGKVGELTEEEMMEMVCEV